MRQGESDAPYFSPEIQAQIDELVNRFESIDGLRKEMPSLPEAVSLLRERLLPRAVGLVGSVWQEAFRRLADAARWQDLAQDPTRFDHELDKVLSPVKKVMKAFYGIPAHRPSKNTARDKEIWRLRKTENLSYGHIALRLGMDSKKARVVERAFKRQDDLEKQNLRFVLAFLFTLHLNLSEDHSPQPQGTTEPSPPSEVPPSSPSPADSSAGSHTNTEAAHTFEAKSSTTEV